MAMEDEKFLMHTKGVPRDIDGYGSDLYSDGARNDPRWLMGKRGFSLDYIGITNRPYETDGDGAEV